MSSAVGVMSEEVNVVLNNYNKADRGKFLFTRCMKSHEDAVTDFVATFHHYIITGTLWSDIIVRLESRL